MHLYRRLINLFRLQRREYYLDFWITPPLTLLLVVYSIYIGKFGVAWLFQIVLGWIAWTLYEYILHRFVLHGLPVGQDVHALHHRNQLDYIAVPPWATLAIYALIFEIFGIRSNMFMIGFSLGYITYSILHTIFHYVQLKPNSLLWRFDQRHVQHHRYSNICYGITVDWWDRLFHTEINMNLK